MTATMVEYERRSPTRIRVSAWPAQGLLWSLTAAGHTQESLAGHLGMTLWKFTAMLGRRRIAVPTHQAVLCLYGQLARQAPPCGTSRERAAAGRARGGAAALGWDPPPARVRRDGRPQMRRGPVEALAAAWAEMASHGMGRAEAAARLRVSRGTLDKAISRQAVACRDLEETSMTKKREHWPPRGSALAENAIELAGYGVTRAEMAERLGASAYAIDQAVTRYNRKQAAETAPAGLPAAVLALVPVPDKGRRRGCGTILALLLHQALREDICEACQVNAAGRGYPVRTAAGTRLAA